MSFVVNAVKKVFKGAVKLVKKAFKILKPVITVAAIYFTAGVAIGAFGGASFVSALPGFGSQGIFANMASGLGSWTGFAGGAPIESIAGTAAGLGNTSLGGVPVVDKGIQAQITAGGATASPAAGGGWVPPSGTPIPAPAAQPAAALAGSPTVTGASVPTAGFAGAPPMEVAGSTLGGAPPSSFINSQIAPQLSAAPTAAAAPLPPPPLQSAPAASLQAAPASQMAGASQAPMTTTAVNNLSGGAPVIDKGTQFIAAATEAPTTAGKLWEGTKTVADAVVDNPITRGLEHAMTEHPALTMVAARGISEAYKAKVEKDALEEQRAYDRRIAYFGKAQDGGYVDLTKINKAYMPPASRVSRTAGAAQVRSIPGQPLINSIRSGAPQTQPSINQQAAPEIQLADVEGGASQGVPGIQQPDIGAPGVPQVTVSSPQMLAAVDNEDILYPRRRS